MKRAQGALTIAPHLPNLTALLQIWAFDVDAEGMPVMSSIRVFMEE